MEKQHQQETNRLNQELQQARTQHNTLQSQYDKVCSTYSTQPALFLITTVYKSNAFMSKLKWVAVRKVLKLEHSFVTVCCLFHFVFLPCQQLLFLTSLYLSCSLLGVSVCVPQVSALMLPLWLQLLSPFLTVFFSYSFVFSFFFSSSWLVGRRPLSQGQCCTLWVVSLFLSVVTHLEIKSALGVSRLVKGVSKWLTRYVHCMPSCRSPY